MTKNEQLYSILDRMFPGEFKVADSRGWLNDPYEFTHVSSLEQLTESSLRDAFWLAEKTGLFEENRGLFRFDESCWYIEELIYNPEDFNSTSMTVAEGPTPQEAIVNAIISIYGEK